jgi:hypothetical protein
MMPSDAVVTEVDLDMAIAEARGGIVRSDQGFNDQVTDLLEAIAAEAGGITAHLEARARRAFTERT